MEVSDEYQDMGNPGGGAMANMPMHQGPTSDSPMVSDCWHFCFLLLLLVFISLIVGTNNRLDWCRLNAVLRLGPSLYTKLSAVKSNFESK